MGEADLPFLGQVYAATRQPELDLVDWTPAQKQAFVAMQFQAQHAHYRLHYAAMDWLVVSLRGTPAGRLYLDRRPSDHAIVDISLLPAHRSGGLGTALLLDVIDEAAAVGKSVSIHVETMNPARQLYERLGFVLEEHKGIYDLMRWTAQPNTAS